MSRRPNPERKTSLLSQVVAYVKEHGVADLTLRPLAAALDTSPRNLLYHFHSSNEMITVTLEAIASEDLALFNELFGGNKPANVADLIEQFATFFDDRNASIRVYVELAALQLTTEADLSAYLSTCTTPWYDTIAGALESFGYDKARARSTSSLIVGTMWGRYITANGDPVGKGKERGAEMVKALIELLS